MVQALLLASHGVIYTAGNCCFVALSIAAADVQLPLPLLLLLLPLPFAACLP
jgi:hypothetical protein